MTKGKSVFSPALTIAGCLAQRSQLESSQSDRAAEMHLLRKLRTFRSLPAGEQRCYLSALLLLPPVDVGLRLFSWQRCQRWAERWARRGQTSAVANASPSPRRIAWLVDQAAQHCPWPATCLRRSLLLWAFLLRGGVASELRLGFRNPDGKFEAHAWVEWNGVPLNDTPDVRNRYAAPAQALTAPKPTTPEELG